LIGFRKVAKTSAEKQQGRTSSEGATAVAPHYYCNAELVFTYMYTTKIAVASRFTGVRLGALIFSAGVLGAIVFPAPMIYAAPTLDVIDQATNTEIATFEHNVIGPAPIGIAVSPNGKQLWVTNSATPPAFNNGTVQVIDVDLSSPAFGQALRLINTGGSPNEIVFNSKGSAAYVLNGGLTGFVDEVRVKTFDILRKNIANSELDSPNPLAMDITEDNSTLYIGNGTSYVNNVDNPG
jgi:hypothetical protein